MPNIFFLHSLSYCVHYVYANFNKIYVTDRKPLLHNAVKDFVVPLTALSIFYCVLKYGFIVSQSRFLREGATKIERFEW